MDAVAVKRAASRRSARAALVAAAASVFSIAVGARARGSESSDPPTAVALEAPVFVSAPAMSLIEAAAVVDRRDRAGTSELQLSGGFTAGPDTILTGFGVYHWLSDNVAVGPLLQLGISDDDFIFAPSFNSKFAFDLAESGGLERLTPYIEGGLGFAYIDKDLGGGADSDDVGFLVDVGFGVEYAVSAGLSIGTLVLFDFLPGEVRDEDFFFSWHVLTFTVHF